MHIKTQITKLVNGKEAISIKANYNQYRMPTMSAVKYDDDHVQDGDDAASVDSDSDLAAQSVAASAVADGCPSVAQLRMRLVTLRQTQ